MKISITGKKPQNLDTKEIRKAIRFFASELMHPFLIRNLQIKIKFQKMLTAWGLTDYEDIDDYKHRNFIILIEPRQQKHFLLKTLGHEMVHVKQYATGELKDVLRIPYAIKWRGKLIKHYKDENDPSEIEAYRLEKKLYRKYKELKQ